MANMYRFKSILSWPQGGPPGVAIFHTTTGVDDDEGDIGNFMNQINSMWADMGPYLVEGFTQTVDPEVTRHDVETGTMNQYPFYVASPPQTVAAGGGLAMARFTMAIAKHNTDAISDRGHRISGRTYIGPLGSNAIDVQGNVTTACQDAVAGAWDGMQDIAGTSRLIIWHRPQKARGAIGEQPAVPASVGSFGHVFDTVCSPTPGVLRSRRD